MEVVPVTGLSMWFLFEVQCCHSLRGRRRMVVISLFEMIGRVCVRPPTWACPWRAIGGRTELVSEYGLLYDM